MQTNVIVRLQVEGVHHWPDCPIEEVSYLKSLHRHVFHIEAKASVTHADRDIEIIKLKHDILRHFKVEYFTPTLNCCNFKTMSCEMIAQELVDKFGLNYCSVLEDNENGAEVIK